MSINYIAFRTDATTQIGTGHFMRCFTLADGLQKQGAKIWFISRNLPDYLNNMLYANGMEYLPLCNDAAQESSDGLAHSSWLGTSQAEDAQATIHASVDHIWDWVIVDHYALDVRWESVVRSRAKQLMVIDDLADRRHDCDLLLDQNLYPNMQTRYSGKVPVHCKLLLGPRYALVRDEFRKQRELLKPRTGMVKRILVFFGGVDADNHTGLTIEVLAAMNSALHVDVVVGAQHPYREEIQLDCISQGYICHVQTAHMAELMADADFAIGAGGSASWERCCLGLPALLVALAENQVDIAKALDSVGASVYISAKEAANLSTLRQVIATLLANHNQLEIISRTAFALVDGLGVNRVCQVLGS